MLSNPCCQAQPQPQPNWGLRWLYFHPTTHPPGIVYFDTMKQNLLKGSSSTILVDPKTVFRPSNPKNTPKLGPKSHRITSKFYN